jgi:hypothetical protein
MVVLALFASLGAIDTVRLKAHAQRAEVTVSTDVAGESGIAGQVSIRPVRSHQKIGTSNSMPYQTTVQVLDSSGRPVTTFESDAGGSFRVALPPGKYILRPQSPGLYPRASEQTVVVSPRNFTQVRIIYDSGIR